MKIADIKVGEEYTVQLHSWGGKERVRVIEVGVDRTTKPTYRRAFTVAGKKVVHDGVRVQVLGHFYDAEGCIQASRKRVSKSTSVEVYRPAVFKEPFQETLAESISVVDFVKTKERAVKQAVAANVGIRNAVQSRLSVSGTLPAWQLKNLNKEAFVSGQETVSINFTLADLATLLGLSGDVKTFHDYLPKGKQ